MALFFNQATLSHNGKSTVSNITTGEIIEAVTATKKAVIPTVLPELTFSDISIPANGNTVLVYQAKINESAPLTTGSTVTNTATVTGNAITGPITAAETITTDDAASLSINKTLSPTTITENGQITYTFIIQNFGIDKYKCNLQLCSLDRNRQLHL